MKGRFFKNKNMSSKKIQALYPDDDLLMQAVKQTRAEN